MQRDFSDEVRMIDEMAERFAADIVAPRAAAIDETNTFPADI